MKKTLSVIFLLTAFLCSYNEAKAFKVLKESKNPEITVEASSNPQQSEEVQVSEIANDEKVIADFPDIKITKKNDMFLIFNKKYNRYTFSSDFEVVKVEKLKNFLGYKLVGKQMSGYVNEDGNIQFFANNMVQIGDYLKVKYGGLYGVYSKDGTRILPVDNEKINLVSSSDGQEYFAVKNDGKYQLYSTNGELIPEEELYSVVTNESVKTEKNILSRDIRPELLGGKRFSLIVYENANPQEASKNDDVTYEVNSIKVPGYVPKIADTETAVKSVANKVPTEEAVSTSQPVIVGKYEFYPKNHALVNSNGDVILPFAADSISFFQPKKLFKSYMLIATKNNVYYVYDMKGNLIAEQTFEKINVYQYGRVYTYTPKEDNTGELTCANKLIGTISQMKDGFEFNQKAFTLLNINKVTDILFAVLKEMNSSEN